MMRELIEAIVAVVAAIVVVTAIVVVAGECSAPCRQDRFGLVSCRPESRACLVFDSYTGDLSFRTLPTLPSQRGEQEVKN